LDASKLHFCGGIDCCYSNAKYECTTAVLPKEQIVKVRPLLCDLEADFAEFAGPDGKLDIEELAGIWQKCAERKLGKLSDEDQRIIASSARMLHDAIDLDRTGYISYEEFATFMLGGSEERGPLRRMRDELHATISKDPTKLNEMIAKFRSWDKNGDGYVTLEELTEHMRELLRFNGKNAGRGAKQMAESIILEADVDHDGQVDLWEALAHALGRRKTPVELLLYDISHGASKKFSPILLGKHFEAIYHSSVIAFGDEYWYGGRIFKNDPPNSKTFGEPLKTSVTKLKPSHYNSDLQVVHLGYTLVTQQEFRTFLSADLCKKFKPDTYDVMTYNCNTFSKEVVFFLTGEQIPEQVSKLPELVLNSPTAKVLRPFLNKWLGGFSGGVGASQGLCDCNTSCAKEAEYDEICQEVLGEGAIVTFNTNEDINGESVGVVTKEDGDNIEVRIFDPITSEFVIRTSEKKTIHRTLSSKM